MKLTNALQSNKMLWLMIMFILVLTSFTSASDWRKTAYDYWNFDTLTGLNTTSQNGQNFTTYGSIIPETGKFGNAIRVYNTTSSYLNLTNPDYINYILNNSNFTINIWVNYNGSSIVLLSGSRTNFPAPFDSYIQGDGAVNYNWGNGLGLDYILTSANLVQKNKWTMITYTRYNDNRSIYINGTIRESKITTRSTEIEHHFQIGSRFAGAYANGNVSVDDFRIYNYTLTSLDIASLYYGNGFLENSQSYTTPVLETSTNTFSINISYDNDYYTSANAYLTYNNTNYTASKSGTGTNAIFTRSITAPSINTNSNVTFYWVIMLNNGTSTEVYTSNMYNQTINNMVFGICNSTNTIRIMNFTDYDEDTRNSLVSPTYNNTYSIDVKIGDYNLNSYAEYYTNTSGNSFSICSNTSLIGNLRMDYTLLYGTSNHVSEYYNVQNYTLNTTTIAQNISLYPLITTNSQEFLIKVKDANFLPLKNYVVQIYRKYVDIGTNLLVEAPITDSLGQTIGHFETNDVVYTINIVKNGYVVATFDNLQVYCNVAITDCILNLNLQSSSSNPSSFINYRGISYLPTYNEATRTYTLQFTTIDNSDKKVDIYGFKLDNTQTQSVCNATITGSSGTLNCAFSGLYENSTILINAYVDNQLLFTDYVTANYDHSDKLRNVRYILLAFMIPFFAMFSFASGSIAVVLYIIGLIFGIGIFALDTKSVLGAGSFVIWFIVAGVILIIKIMKGGIKNG